MPKVGIVIVNYNGERYQNDCIKSLYEMNNKDFAIIVVDSGSKDHSIELLRSNYPDVHIIEMGDNVGVAAGNNIGIRYSRQIGTEFTMLMNNDTVVAPDLLENLLEASQGKKVVVPKIYYYDPDTMIWFAGGELNNKKGTNVHYGIGEYEKGQYDEVKCISYAPTCCMLVPNDVFDVVGKMDEKYFMYYDDTDFCLRIGKKNIKLLYVPQATMWHKVSSSTGGEASPLAVYYNTRNRFYYIKKHSDVFPKNVMLYAWLSNILQFIVSPIRFKNDKYIYYALKDYLRGNMGRRDNLIKSK